MAPEQTEPRGAIRRRPTSGRSASSRSTCSPARSSGRRGTKATLRRSADPARDRCSSRCRSPSSARAADARTRGKLPGASTRGSRAASTAIPEARFANATLAFDALAPVLQAPAARTRSLRRRSHPACRWRSRRGGGAEDEGAPDAAADHADGRDGRAVAATGSLRMVPTRDPGAPGASPDLSRSPPCGSGANAPTPPPNVMPARPRHAPPSSTSSSWSPCSS